MDPLQEAIQKTFTDKKLEVNTIATEAEFQEATKVDATKEEKKPDGSTDQKVEDKEKVLSNTEKLTTEKEVKAEEVKTEIKTPTFEQLITERSKDKYKSWDEIEAKLNEPKIEFADEQVQKINDYIKNGGKIDNQWLTIQNTDYNKITDPFELISEAMRLEEPGITDKEIEYRIKNDYKTDEWSEDKDETTEVEEVMSAKMLREANKAKIKLQEYQKKSSFAPTQKTESQLKDEAKVKDEVQRNWEKTVDESAKGFEKIPVKIDEKDTFEVIVSKEERETLNTMAKQMGTSMTPLISKFLDEKGNVDVKRMQNYLYKAENFDNAVKTAYTQGVAKGSLNVVKDIKNVNFSADGKSEAPKARSVKEQVGEQLISMM